MKTLDSVPSVLSLVELNMLPILKLLTIWYWKFGKLVNFSNLSVISSLSLLSSQIWFYKLPIMLSYYLLDIFLVSRNSTLHSNISVCVYWFSPAGSTDCHQLLVCNLFPAVHLFLVCFILHGVQLDAICVPSLFYRFSLCQSLPLCLCLRRLYP